MSDEKSDSERQLKSTSTFFNDGNNSCMAGDAAKTSSGRQSPTPSCTESSAATLQCQQKHHHQHNTQQHRHHSPSHLSLAKSLSDVSEALDTFFNDSNTGTAANPKRQQTTATAEALLATSTNGDGACTLQKRPHADTDLLSLLEDPKSVATDGAGRSFEALDDIFMLPGNSWSDMVHEMESEKKSRVLRKG